MVRALPDIRLLGASLYTMREIAVEDGSRQNSGIAAPGQEAERGSLRGDSRCIRCYIPGKGSTAIMRVYGDNANQMPRRPAAESSALATAD